MAMSFLKVDGGNLTSGLAIRKYDGYDQVSRRVIHTRHDRVNGDSVPGIPGAFFLGVIALGHRAKTTGSCTKPGYAPIAEGMT